MHPWLISALFFFFLKLPCSHAEGIGGRRGGEKEVVRMGWGFSAWEKEEGESMQGRKREREKKIERRRRQQPLEKEGRKHSCRSGRELARQFSGSSTFFTPSGCGGFFPYLSGGEGGKKGKLPTTTRGKKPFQTTQERENRVSSRF